MAVEVKVDATRALAKFDRIPIAVRNALRISIPDLTKELGAKVNANLDSGLKSRVHLAVAQKMIENAQQIVGRVSIDWTGDKKSSMVPDVLESGARPHEIVAVNANALAFFWDRMGTNVFFKRVQHPGFAGIHYMQQAFDSMKDQIKTELTRVVKIAASGK